MTNRDLQVMEVIQKFTTKADIAYFLNYNLMYLRTKDKTIDAKIMRDVLTEFQAVTLRMDKISIKSSKEVEKYFFQTTEDFQYFIRMKSLHKFSLLANVMRGVDSVRSEEDLKMVSSFMKEAVADSYKILEKKRLLSTAEEKNTKQKHT